MTFPKDQIPKTEEELRLALNDREWRLHNFYQIQDKKGNKITFKPNRAQADFEKNRHGRDIILKSRQLGFTTFESIKGLDHTLFNKNQDSLFIAQTKDEAVKIFDKKIDFAWKNLKPNFRKLWSVDTDKANMIKYNFADGSQSSISVSNSGRSGTNNLVHISEFAKLCVTHPTRANEIVKGTIPSIPLDGSLVIESTAEGEDGLFHDMFWDAYNRKRDPLKTELKAHFYNWQWDDGVDEVDVIAVEDMDEFKKFRDIKAQHNLDEKEITYYYIQWLALQKDWQALKQEYPITPEEAFVTSGKRFFDTDRVQELETIEGEQYDDNTIIYKPFRDTHRYVIGCDVAHGVGRDASTVVVVDIDTDEVVCEYFNNQIEADMFAYDIKRIAQMYGSPLVAVERNDRGYTTLSKLREIYSEARIYKADEKNAFRPDLSTNKFGFITNSSTKPRILMDLKTSLNEGVLKVNSNNIKNEMRVFSTDKLSVIKFDAATSHYDLLMAYAIAWFVRLSPQVGEKNLIQEEREHRREDTINDYQDELAANWTAY